MLPSRCSQPPCRNIEYSTDSAGHLRRTRGRGRTRRPASPHLRRWRPAAAGGWWSARAGSPRSGRRRPAAGTARRASADRPLLGRRGQQEDDDVGGDQRVGNPRGTPQRVDVVNGNHHDINLPDRRPQRQPRVQPSWSRSSSSPPAGRRCTAGAVRRRSAPSGTAPPCAARSRAGRSACGSCAARPRTRARRRPVRVRRTDRQSSGADRPPLSFTLVLIPASFFHAHTSMWTCRPTRW